MLNIIKNELSVDDEDLSIMDLIEAARSDLMLSGVSQIKANLDTDPLIKRAIILYCKANYKYDPFTERYQMLYISLKQHLTMAHDYQEVRE